MSTLGEFILAGKARLEAACLECADPLLHMKQMVEASLHLTSSDLIARWEQPLTPEMVARVESLLERRLQGEPFQYIVGYEWFWNWKFAVGPGVLIPRPETELLVDLALRLETRQGVKVAELGTGTGVIGISLLQERPKWEWFAWEANLASVPYLESNLALLPARAQYHWYAGDFFQGIEKMAPYDWLIANPPYVKHAEIASLSREVRHEPAQALDGGESGLEIVSRLITVATKVLAPGGGLLLEIGSDQGPQVLELLNAAGLSAARIEKDLAGKDRVAYARRA